MDISKLHAVKQSELHNILASKIINNCYFDAAKWHEINIAELSFNHCLFVNNHFSSAELKKLKAYNCHFINCNFSHINFTDSQFDACCFYDPQSNRGGDFSYACLKHTKFLDCDLSFSSFKYAELFGIQINSCKIIGGQFEKANFYNKLSPKIIIAQADILDSNLRFSNWTGTYLANCQVVGNDFTEADFSYTTLTDANFSHCILNNVTFAHATVTGLDLQYALFSGTDLHTCQLNGVIITSEQCISLLQLFGIIIN